MGEGVKGLGMWLVFLLALAFYSLGLGAIWDSIVDLMMRGEETK